MRKYVVVSFVFTNERRYLRQEGENMCDILKKINQLPPEKLLEKYGVDTTPPINISQLIKNIGISSYPFNFSRAEAVGGYEKGTIVGAAISTGDKLDILYSEELSDEEARATVAHELGHCCLHTDEVRVEHIKLRTLNIPRADEEKENSAEEFAQELLIPEKSLKIVMELLIKPTVNSLAEVFQVSRDMMKSRLKKLGLYSLFDNASYNGQPS